MQRTKRGDATIDEHLTSLACEGQKRRDYEERHGDHDPDAIVEEIDVLASDPCNSYLERVIALDERNAGVTMRQIANERGLRGARQWFTRPKKGGE